MKNTAQWLGRLRHEQILGGGELTIDGLARLENEVDLWIAGSGGSDHNGSGNGSGNGNGQHASSFHRGLMRVQLDRSGPSTFEDVRKTSNLLHQLGVGLFSSPVMAGDLTHGYQCWNPNAPHANQDHGEFLDLLSHLAERGMMLVVDVPYHVSTCKRSSVHFDLARRRRFCYADKQGRTLGFMDFGEFAKLRVEDPSVSREYHLLLRLLIKMGLLHGLRLDAVEHVPGVVNLLHDLRELGVPIIVECDLSVEALNGEQPPLPGPASGATGEDFRFNALGAVSCLSGQRTLRRLQRRLSGEHRSPDEIARDNRPHLLRECFGTQFAHLRELIEEVQDVAEDDIREAVLEVANHNRVFHDFRGGTLSHSDQQLLVDNVHNETLRGLLLVVWNSLDEEDTSVALPCGARATIAQMRDIRAVFTALTNGLYIKSLIRAKPHEALGVEYPAITSNEFHRRLKALWRHYPQNWRILSHHDSPTGLDSSAMLATLTQFGGEWGVLFDELFARTKDLHQDSLDPGDVHRLYQVILAAPSASNVRIFRHLRKDLREAGRTTDWGWRTQRAYEFRLRQYLLRLRGCGLSEQRHRHEAFVELFEPFSQRLSEAAERTIASLVLMQWALPGQIPVGYLLELSNEHVLGDPDNRRPARVDDIMQQLMALRSGAPVGRDNYKLYILTVCQKLRATRPEAYAKMYEAIDAPEGWLAARIDDGLELWVPIRHDAPPAGPGEGWTNLIRLPFGFHHGLYAKN